MMGNNMFLFIFMIYQMNTAKVFSGFEFWIHLCKRNDDGKQDSICILQWPLGSSCWELLQKHCILLLQSRWSHSQYFCWKIDLQTLTLLTSSGPIISTQKIMDKWTLGWCRKAWKLDWLDWLDWAQEIRFSVKRESIESEVHSFGWAWLLRVSL